jgi:hypothetical protein
MGWEILCDRTIQNKHSNSNQRTNQPTKFDLFSPLFHIERQPEERYHTNIREADKNVSTKVDVSLILKIR